MVSVLAVGLSGAGLKRYKHSSADIKSYPTLKLYAKAGLRPHCDRHGFQFKRWPSRYTSLKPGAGV